MEENQTNGSSPNNDPYRQKSRYFYGRAYPGVFLIVVGVIFLLNNYGFIQGEAWGKLWPIFIILPGIFMLLRPRRP
jgi:hypothetical protein